MTRQSLSPRQHRRFRELSSPALCHVPLPTGQNQNLSQRREPVPTSAWRREGPQRGLRPTSYRGVVTEIALVGTPSVALHSGRGMCLPVACGRAGLGGDRSCRAERRGSAASGGKPSDCCWRVVTLCLCGAARRVTSGDTPEPSANLQHNQPIPWPVLQCEGVVIPSRAGSNARLYASGLQRLRHSGRRIPAGVETRHPPARPEAHCGVSDGRRSR